MRILQRFKRTSGSSLLTTLFILAGIMTAAIIGTEIVLSGFSAYMTQGSSGQAYYAAEAGMERALTIYKLDQAWFHRLDGEGCGGAANRNNIFINFDNDKCDTDDNGENNKKTLEQGGNLGIIFKGGAPQYKVKVSYWDYVDKNNLTQLCSNCQDAILKNYGDIAGGQGRVIQLNAQGGYLSTSRELRVTFCVPNCNVKENGLYDWCGGVCN